MSLPESKIIDSLQERASIRKDIDFDFIGKLEDFRKVVSAEIGYIKVLFPEFTPHDEQFHIKKLFFIGDTLLGQGVIQNLNSAELLILSLALYGHDWGMAVSEDEKQFIIGKQKPDNSTLANNLLFNEDKLYEVFCEENNIKDPASVSTELWREYVRKTHALRSGSRVRKYFEKDGLGIGEAAARACEGHWLDFEELEDYNKYPLDYSVLSEPINLRAITIYVRLIDLFDIGDDRTPYVIWKYVAPINTISKFEWQKHRCLNPITISAYQGGRIIKVDGSTNDHEVYAAILDMKNYCDMQLRKCNDLLAYMNDSRTRLDIFHCEWRINTIGFIPAQIKFEFDRGKMFEILGHNIYDDDPYVFLRELLQNSIDAITFRKAVLHKEPINMEGKITLNISKLANGNIQIKWRDNGCGMDEYIVKNYLSVAGVSYYRSEDFARLNLPIDPISKFGVGILSCFMLANGITIESRREPYVRRGHADALTIKIVDKQKEFRIERATKELTEVGTLIVLELNIKILDKIFKRKTEEFNITKYLSEIAAFTPYSIHINEYGKETVILNCLSKETGSIFTKYDLAISYDEILEPFCIKDASQYLAIENISNKEMKLKDAIGAISFLKFSKEVVEIHNAGHSWPANKFDLYVKINGEVKKVKLEIKNSWENRHSSDRKIGASRKQHNYFGVYSNGILVSNARPPEYRTFEDRFSYRDFCYAPKININFIKNKLSDQISLSRNDIAKQGGNWNQEIIKKLLKYLSSKYNDSLADMVVKDRPLNIGKFIQEYRLEYIDMISYFDNSLVPIPFLTSSGKIKLKSLNQLTGNTLLVAPSFFSTKSSSLFAGKEIDKKLKKYLPPTDSLIFNSAFFMGSSGYFTSSYLGLVKQLIKTSYSDNGIIFFSSKDNKLEIARLILSKQKLPLLPIDDLVLKGITSYKSLTQSELQFILKDISEWFLTIHNIYKFPLSHKEKISYGINLINADHEIIAKVITGLLKLKSLKDTVDTIAQSKLKASIEASPLCQQWHTGEKSIEDLNDSIFSILQHLDDCLKTQISSNFEALTLNSFTKGSVKTSKGKLHETSPFVSAEYSHFF